MSDLTVQADRLTQAAQEAQAASASISFRSEASATFDVIADRAAQTVGKALQWTAADIRKTAQRSIKSGGKSKNSKNYLISKPGEAPRSHQGKLKQGIQYAEIDGGYIIGAGALGSSRAPGALEYGGQGTFTTTVYSDSYTNRRRASRRKRARNWRGVHPRAARPYRVNSEAKPGGVIVRDYLYFYSEPAWRRARGSSAFQAWANAQRMTTTSSARVEARPFMAPALAQETTDTKMRSRMSRAIKAGY